MMYPQPVAVAARPNCKIWVKYADGPSGEVDLSDLAGRGPYAAWSDAEFFRGVYIDPETQAIAWGNNVEICPDAVYLAVTGRPYKEVFPELTEPPVIGWLLEAEKSALNYINALEVEPRNGYRIWLRYSDGAAGEVDLSHLADWPVFQPWRDRAFFEKVFIGESGEVTWPGELDLDPWQLYMDLTGKTVEDLFPGLAGES